MMRESENVFDKNIITTAGTENYDGVKIFDINGNSGSDYIVLMTVACEREVPFTRLKLFWEQGNPYQSGPLAYLGEPTRAWPVGFDIYTSNTGASGSWQKIYHADSLEGQLKTEVVDPLIWDDSEGIRPYYEFNLGSTYNAKYIRFAVAGMEPFLGDIQIHEIHAYADKSSIPSNYKKVNVTVDNKADYDIDSAEIIGEDYCKTGASVTLKITPKDYARVKSVKVDGTTITGRNNVYVFTMPSSDTTVNVQTELKSAENVPLAMESYSVAGGETVYSNTVPVITFNFNNKVGEISKSMISVNGEKNSDLIQRAFVDSLDRTKVHVVPFADKLEAGKTYKVSIDGSLKSLAGMWMSGMPAVTITTAEDYCWSYNILNKKYINGYGDGTFRPDQKLNINEAIIIGERIDETADFSMILPRLEPIKRVDFARIIYTLRKGFALDSNKDMFDALIREGVFRGNEAATYDPDGYVTRAEAVVLFNRAIGRNTDNVEYSPEDIFTDVPEDHWARNDITIAASDKYSTALPWTEDIKPVQLDVNNEKNNIWTQVPAVSQEIRDMGESGGEGGQWMQAIECDNVDGQLLFAGVDIAGLLRSTDGGRSWTRSYRGFNATGCVDIDIDPNNKNRVIAIGSLSSEPFCGIYLSEDMGTNWQHVYSFSFNGQRDTRDQLAWDKSSYDSGIGGSKIAYWSTMWKLTAGLEGSDKDGSDDRRTHNKGGLIKTTDGGKTWAVVNSDMSDSVVEVHPTKGYVYIGNERGFFRSEDGGVTFTQIISGTPVYGLDVIETYPDNVYINDKDGVLISTDGGKTFTRPANSGFPYRPTDDVRNMVRDLAVSPANPNNMMVDCRDYVNYRNYRYYTNDGGKLWHESAYDGSKDFFYNHSRQHPYAWHPTDPNKVWSLGGDWVTSSNDAGKTFIWDANGVCGTPPGGRLSINPFNPELMFFSAQDLTGLFSKNGGYTFTPIETVGGWGNSYGAYAVDENLVFFARADGWYSERYLYVSNEGGDNPHNTGLQLHNGTARRATSFWGSIKDRDTFFAGEYVSRDRCESWTRMAGCDFVMAINYYHNREMYGIYEEHIVVSYDDGKIWLPLTETYIDDEEVLRNFTSIYTSGSGAHCWDIAYDGINDILYYIQGSGNSGHVLVKVVDNVHKNISGNIQTQDAMGDKWYQIVNVDPRHPEIVYLGGYGAGSQKTTNSIQRSCDFGESFQIISSMGDSKSIVPDGPSTGSGAETLVVHPETGEVWMWTTAEGLWTFPAPYDE